MLPKNKDLFGKLTPEIAPFFLPKEPPWKALQKAMSFLEDCKSGIRPWPESLPRYIRPTGKEADEAQGDIPSFGAIHVRGGSGLKSDKHSQIIGPVVLGKGVKIRKGAVLTGPCWIGDGVTIGYGCRIKRSVILAGTEIVFGTLLAHAVIGERVRIGPSVVSEYEPCPPDSTVQFFEKDTGLAQLGLIAGDGCWIGGGGVFGPGVVLAQNSRLGAAARCLYGRLYSE